MRAFCASDRRGRRAGRRVALLCAVTLVAVLAGAGGLCAARKPKAAKLPAQAAPEAPEGVIRFDFETGLQGWKVVEGKLGNAVADLNAPKGDACASLNKEGKSFLTTAWKGAGSRKLLGVIESPVFTLTGEVLTLRVGGGDEAGVYVALCEVGGKELVKVRGKNSEVMRAVRLDVRKYKGRKVFLRACDTSEDTWGFVSVDDVTVGGVPDKDATKTHFKKRTKILPKVVKASKPVAPAPPPTVSKLEALRAAVADLVASFGSRYPGGAGYLNRLDALERRTKTADKAETKALDAELVVLQREALIANPLVSGSPILFIVRNQYERDHHNTATLFQNDEINTSKFQGPGAIKVIDFGVGAPGRVDVQGKVRTLLTSPKGVARDPDVSFDGKRVLFSMRNDVKDDYHLYEVGADGTGLRQITFGRGVSDIDPIYMPDGSIVACSSREPKYCMCNRHIMANLFRMDADGANIRQIGRSTLFEGHAFLMPDGTILYDRWEYVDRNFGDAQGLWTCGPDGTNHALYYGNNTTSPGAILDARVIPGTGGQQFVATYSSCHDRPWGAMALVDRQRGLDSPGPELRAWPVNAAKTVGKGNFDAFQKTNPKYEDPYPLAELAPPPDGEAPQWLGAGKYFLVSRMVGKGEQMGLYLLDVFGNDILLHSESLGCYDPMPLAPRLRPPVLPERIDLAGKQGAFYVHNIYRGTGMDKVERGSVKSLRVIESPEKRFWTKSGWTGGGAQAPAMNWHDFNNKRILGTVPVEADGSAYFTLPADRFVFFQLLDKDGMMVQTMRSGTIVRPGETTGCVGCHEDRLSAVPNGLAAAMRRPPHRLRPWRGEERLFSYAREVQPVFDKHCLRCHDYGGKGSKKLVLAGDRTLVFNTSYNELWRKKYVRAIGAGPAAILPPFTWGSHRSKIIEVLRKGHNDVKLDRESFDRLVTWIDLNAPYYASYAGTYANNPAGRSPLDDKQIKELQGLTGVDFSRQRRHSSNLGPQVSFDRPEKSPCLAKIKEKDPDKYAKALAIIAAGQKMLAERPREDMPRVTLHGEDARREEKYRHLAGAEDQVRRAITAGDKHFYKDDTPPQQER